MQECVGVPPVLAEPGTQGGFVFLLAVPEEIVERFGVPNDSFVQCCETVRHGTLPVTDAVHRPKAFRRGGTTSGSRTARPRAAASSGTGARRSRHRGAAPNEAVPRDAATSPRPQTKRPRRIPSRDAGLAPARRLGSRALT